MTIARVKIALIGAGNIGGTLAQIAMQRPGLDVVLFDIKPGLAQGKALDLLQMAAAQRDDAQLLGTENYQDIAGSDFVIVTAGFPRQPGMSRDDLLEKNARVMQSVGEAIKTYCPDAFVICVTNPLDAMVHLLQHVAQIPDERIVGMAGELDSCRFQYFLAEHFGCSVRDVDAKVLGGHGDTMVPLTGLSRVQGLSLQQHLERGTLSQQDLDALIQRTRQGGAEIVSLLQQGSAFYAPALCSLKMAEAVQNDRRALFCAAAKVTPDLYPVPEPLFVGVPIVLGRRGVQKVEVFPLSDVEQQQLAHSIKAVSEQIADLRRLNFLS